MPQRRRELPTTHAAAAEPDAEVSFVTRDLAPMLPNAEDRRRQSPIDDVIARVREAAELDRQERPAQHADRARRRAGIKLAYAGRRRTDPYAGFEARIVPENITLLPKTATRRPAAIRATKRSSSSRRATASRRSCAISARSPTISGHRRPAWRRAAATAASRKARSCAFCCRRCRAGSAAAGARDRRRRQRVEAVVALSDTGQVRAGRRAEASDTEVADNAQRGRRETTAPASASTKASTRRRCATRCRGRSSTT